MQWRPKEERIEERRTEVRSIYYLDVGCLLVPVILTLPAPPLLFISAGAVRSPYCLGLSCRQANTRTCLFSLSPVFCSRPAIYPISSFGQVDICSEQIPDTSGALLSTRLLQQYKLDREAPLLADPHRWNFHTGKNPPICKPLLCIAVYLNQSCNV